MAPRGYKPKPGERNVGYIDPNARDSLSKAIRRKRQKLSKQGKPSPGFVQPDELICVPGQPRVGIQIGKKAFIFELRGNQPIVIGSQMSSRSACIIEVTFKSIAKCRFEFVGLPKTERETVLIKVKAELKRGLRETDPVERKFFLDEKRRFRSMKPSAGRINNVGFGLTHSKTVGELDVFWEYWSRNTILKKRYERAYQQKRKQLQ